MKTREGLKDAHPTKRNHLKILISSDSFINASVSEFRIFHETDDASLSRDFVLRDF